MSMSEHGSRGTFQVDGTGWSRGLAVEVGGRDVVSHVGTAALRLLADRVGMTAQLGGAGGDRFAPLHERGRVFTDIAVGIADGGTQIGDIVALGDQKELFGAGPHCPTLEDLHLPRYRRGHRPGRVPETGTANAPAAPDVPIASTGHSPVGCRRYGRAGDR